VLDPLFDADFSHVPPPVLLLALDAAAAPLLRHFESLWGGPIDAVACGPMPAELALPGAAVELGFSLRGDAGEILACGALFASVAALQPASLCLPLRANATERGAIPVWVGIELSRVRLSLAELLDLAPGDAIRIGRVTVPPQPRFVTLAPGGRPMLRARLNEQQLIVESTVANPEENPVIAQGSSELDALDDVQCTVAFEVGRLQMSVAEVAALRAGSTVALASRLDDQPVWIVVNGQRVGRGDLAEVGDELVVVVTALRR
jgi:type III secretion system YscQ/HrcQ family protein